MKKTLALIAIIICQFVSAQEVKPPVGPLYDNGGIENFYNYISKSIDFNQFHDEKDLIIAFVLDREGSMKHIKVAKKLENPPT